VVAVNALIAINNQHCHFTLKPVSGHMLTRCQTNRYLTIIVCNQHKVNSAFHPLRDLRVGKLSTACLAVVKMKHVTAYQVAGNTV